LGSRTGSEAEQQVGKLDSGEQRRVAVGQARRILEDLFLLRQDAEQVDNVALELAEGRQGIVEQQIAERRKQRLGQDH
jgi:hypothetical protein